MGLIKSENTPIGLSPFSMRDIEVQAQILLARARKAADQLLADAQKEAETIRQTAKTEGLVEGKRQGFSQGNEEGKKSGHQAALTESKAQLTAMWNALSAAVTQIDLARRDLESAALREVVDLASAIARRVARRQAKIDPVVLLENLQEAMKLAVQSADVRIIVNPAQRKTLNEELPRLQLLWPNVSHVEVLGDPDVAAGGCRILTREGEVDAQIDVQLDRVINDLLPDA